jgi:myo-inositol 2-dehydrogenase / D-chiro-inositol 1-dehydrogenase
MNSPASVNVTTRRQFLRTSAAAASVMALGPLDIARTAHAAGSDVLRVGMIGCGGRNSGAAVQALTADRGRDWWRCTTFSWTASRRSARRSARERGAGGGAGRALFPGVDGYKQVIEASDVVLIANAAKFHPMHTMAAIQAGRHVFVEKPHGIDPAGLKLMDAACALAKDQRALRRLGIAQPVSSGLRRDGSTDPRRRDRRGDRHGREFSAGALRGGGSQAGLSELEWQFSTQYHFRWLSGDDVVQSLVHNLDRASWVMHNQVPVKCHGLGGRSSMTDPMYGDVFDHHSVIYEFENGVRVYAFCRTTTGCYDEASSIILGSKGKASILACRIWGEKAWRWQGQGDPYQIEHDRLFAAIRSGTAFEQR